MRFRAPSLLALTCLLLSHPAPADTIVLRNGETLEGHVLRETEEAYVVEVKVSASIRDEKIIPRSEVARIEKEPEHEKAFRNLEGLVPVPELLGEEEYQQRIELLEAYLTEFLDSTRVTKVKEMLDAVGSELDVVSAGGLKLGDELVSGEEYAANAYGYDALIAEKKIKYAVARRDFLSSLRMFGEYEASFAESEGRAGLSALMVQVLGAYRASVTDSLASLDARLKDRAAGLERMSPEDRLISERAIQEEKETLAKRYADEKAARVKWITPDAFHRESMNETLRMIASEISRLERATPSPATTHAEVYRASWEKLADGNVEEKKAVLEAAKAKRLPEPYLEKLRERAALPEE
jgi:hypothetical protein